METAEGDPLPSTVGWLPEAVRDCSPTHEQSKLRRAECLGRVRLTVSVPEGKNMLFLESTGVY
jgi:hypothetical protein